MKRWFPLLALLPFLGLAATAPAASELPDNLVVEELPNGLQVVIEERHATPVVRVTAYMRIGSLYEGEYLGSGLSHYMEHIVAGGSTRRKVAGRDGKEVWQGRTEEQNKALVKSIGGNTNAKTFFNFTQYFITTKSEMAETAIDLVSDYLQHCQFDPVEVKREQGVVQQELLRNLDNPNRFRSQLFAETMYKVHPARVPVIGYRDCIQRITREDMLRFYRTHYTPQNCVVSIVGDVDKQAVLESVRRYFGGWKRKPLEPYWIPEEPEQTRLRWVERTHGSTQTCLVAMGVPTIPLQDPDLYALDMLANVLGLGASARLPRKLEHDPTRKVVATGIGTSSWTPVFGAGRFAVYFGADTVENARALVWEAWQEMERLKDELVTPEEIARALKVLEKYHYLGRATVDKRSEELASNLAWVHDPLFNDSYLEKIRQVTPEQVRAAARKYLRRDRLNVTIVTPPQAAAPPRKEEAARRAGEVRKVELENGLTLLLKRVPDYGLVDVVAAFRGGVIYEDEQNNGLFFLMANTFWRGTPQRPFPQLMQEMDQLGMELSAASHNNVYFIKMRSLASDLEKSFDIFSDVLLHPALQTTWVERVKMLLRTRVLPNLEVNATEICARVMRRTLYQRHPYRFQRYGTPETVSSFTTEQVRELYEAFTRPNNCVLAIYGDIDPERTEQVVRAALGGWKPAPIPPSKVVEEPDLSAPQTVALENRQVRVNYRIAWRAIARQDEAKRAPLSVMNTILGAQGWLHTRLREGSNKYVYSVYGAPYTGDRAGHYYIETDFSPQDEAPVLKIIDGAIADLRAGRFRDEELDLAKRMIQCYDALGKIENASVAQGNALSELFGQGWDYDREFYAAIEKVTREDVVRLANEIFSRPALRIFVRPAPEKEEAKDKAPETDKAKDKKAE